MIVAGPDNPAFRLIRGILYGWVFVLVLALCPWTEDPAAPVKELASGAALLAMVAIWTAALLTGRAPYRELNPPLWLAPVFFGMLGITALCSGAAPRSLDALRPWVVFALLGFIAYQVAPRTHHLRNLFRVIAVSVALSSAYGLAQHFGFDPFPWGRRDVEEYRALPATYGNPNLAGHALVIALVLLTGLAADAWQRKRWSVELGALAGIGALMLAHLHLTHMRGGPVALFAAGLFVAAFSVARRRKHGPVGACVRALCVCGGGLALAAAVLLACAPFLDLDSSLQLRLHGYAGAAAMFLDNALLGVGPGNYAFHNMAYWSEFEGLWYALEGKRNFHVHNEWLEMAAESGIAGLAVFVGVFLFALTTFFENPYLVTEQHRALALAIPAALVAVAADACFGFNLHAPVSAALFFLLLPLRPTSAFYSWPTRQIVRRASLLLLLTATSLAWTAWRDFEHEWHYQRAQGAIAWERGQRMAGDTENAAQSAEVAFAQLEQLESERPWDYRVPMLRGDFAMERNRVAEAVEAFERALVLHPRLPRLHVQLARANIRAAQSGALESGPALDAARRHARTAKERCPELAEAWAMLGWAHYATARLAGAKAPMPSSSGLEEFEHARALGLPADEGVDAALGELYARMLAWPESAGAYARAAIATPGNPGLWTPWREAATQAGGDAMIQYRQALLFQLDRYLADGASSGIAGETAAQLAGHLSTLPGNAAQGRVVQRALERAAAQQPSQLIFWSAWLGGLNPSLRKGALIGQRAALHGRGEAALAPPIAELDRALESPGAATCSAAAKALAEALATPPGREDRAQGALHAPLVALLDEALRDSGLAVAMPGTALRDWGIALFETGEVARAEEILRHAEAVLPPAEQSLAFYYRSRALAVLGQPDAALALAKAAMDAGGGDLLHQWNMAQRLAGAGHVEAARFAYESLLSTLALGHPFRAWVEAEQHAIPKRGEAP